MNIEITQLTPEAINKAVMDAVVKSSIGKVVEECVTKAVNDLGRAWDNPIEKVIKQHIQQIMLDVLNTKFKDRIQEMVTSKMTEAVSVELFDKIWKAVERKWD